MRPFLCLLSSFYWGHSRSQCLKGWEGWAYLLEQVNNCPTGISTCKPVLQWKCEQLAGGLQARPKMFFLNDHFMEVQGFTATSWFFLNCLQTQEEKLLLHKTFRLSLLIYCLGELIWWNCLLIAFQRNKNVWNIQLFSPSRRLLKNAPFSGFSVFICTWRPLKTL